LGRVTIAPITVDMNKLVGELRRGFEGETTGRTIEWQVSDLAPARADPSMIRLVVQNLIDNALKFSRNNDMAEITIGCKPGAEFQTYWVRDNGVGFDMTYVGKLFGVFQRLHRVEEFEGTGIGLAHVKRIIERHKGRVWAESQPDCGATFYFTLPRPKRRS
jgi:two-component system, chemotaxis family, sensor kinase Cph1